MSKCEVPDEILNRIPSWATWVAQIPNGNWTAYDEDPSRGFPKRFIHLGYSAITTNWREHCYPVSDLPVPPAIRAMRNSEVSTLDVLIMCRDWINNLIKEEGETAVLNCLPNNTGGRVWLEQCIANLENPS